MPFFRTISDFESENSSQPFFRKILFSVLLTCLVCAAFPAVMALAGSTTTLIADSGDRGFNVRTPNQYSISGTVTDGANPIQGVTISFTSQDYSPVTTDDNGNYSRAIYENSSTTITPTLDGWRFDPESRSVNSITYDIPGLNFTGHRVGVTTPTYPLLLLPGTSSQ